MTGLEFGGTPKCLACKGTGLDPHVERDCGPCHGKGYMTAEERQAYENRNRNPNPVIRASDRIVPIVQDNEFSKEALEKAIHSGSAASKRRVILTYLHDTFPKAVSSSQMEEIQGWLHQSCSSTFTGLHKAGLVSVVAWRINQRNRREGMYALSGLARGAWSE